MQNAPINKRSSRNTSARQQWHSEIEPNFCILYVNIHILYPANFIKTINMIQ